MQFPYLTASEVAEELGMSTDGVYKLIKRGKLPAIRRSENSLRVSRLALEAYQRRLQDGNIDMPPIEYSNTTPHELRAEFEQETGLSPSEWESRWKADQFEDSAENMNLAIRALSLLLHERGEQQPAENRHGDPRERRTAA
jgi:excisionase family DNA binding protein